MNTTGIYHLTEQFYENSPNFSNRLIYITSDEEIRISDWCINLAHKQVVKPTDAEWANSNHDNLKKIILTTDPDLIEGGVQSIDDDFIKWFIKNSSCEFVEVIYGLINPMGRQVDSMDLGQNHSYCVWKYKIIIPQETFLKSDNCDGEWLSPIAEERAYQEEKLKEIFGHYPNASPRWQYMNGLIQNSLQVQKMYSEEELLNILESHKDIIEFDGKNFNHQQWFEQFKKK
jgi:hypothetical protein